MCRATDGDFANPLAGPRWNGWGVNTANTRYQDGSDGRIHRGRGAASAAEMGLRLSGRAQRRRAADGGRRPRVRRHPERHRLFAQRRDRLRPLVFSGRRRRARGHQHRPHRTPVPDRATRRSSATAPRNVYAVDAATGELLWKTKVDDFPFARVTGSPAFHNGRLYVGVASGEETAGATADYECCRFRGSLVALNAATGAQIWKTYTIAEEPRPTTKNKIGTQLWGPSGVPIWTSPAIDVGRNAVYVTTGNNYSDPADQQQRCVRRIRSRFRQDPLVPPDDRCRTPGTPPAACRTGSTAPNADAPDFDFASPPILVTLAERPARARGRTEIRSRPRPRSGSRGRRSSGRSASARAASTAACSGARPPTSPMSMSRSPTSGGSRCPNSQATVPDPEAGGGMFALRLDNGQRVWYTPPPAVRDRDALQSRAIGGGQRDSRCGVLGVGRRTPARLFRCQRRRPVGLRYGPHLRNRERCSGAGRIAERREVRRSAAGCSSSTRDTSRTACRATSCSRSRSTGSS